MARISLYNGGEISANPTGVRVPMVGQGVTAGPAAGNALVQIGQLGMQIAAKQQQANDTRQLIEAEGEMRRHASEFGQFQQSTVDQEQWLPEWQRRQGEMQKHIDKLKLTDDARLRLTSSFGRWADGHAMEVQGQAFKQAVGRSVDAVKLRASEGAKAGDRSQIDSAFKLAMPGSMTPEQEALWKNDLYNQADDVQRKQIDAQNTTDIKNEGSAALPKVRARLEESGTLFDKTERESRLAGADYGAEVQSLEVLAYDDPRRALELAPLKLRGPERIRVMDAAGSRINELRSNSVKEYTSQIQMGVADKEKMASKILDDANLETVDKANLASFLDRGPVNDPVAYASLYAEAKSFDGKEGSPEYSRLLSRVDMTLKEDQKSSVIAALSDSVKAPKDGASKAKAAIYSQMSDDLRAGMFGPLHGVLANPATKLSAKDRAEVDAIKAEMITPAEQERLKTEPKRIDYLEGKARETWWTRNHQKPVSGETWNNYVVDDEDSKRAASDRAWAAMASFEKWQAENPKATPQESKVYYDSLLVRQRATVSGNPLIPPVETPKVDLNAILKKYAPNP